MAVMFTLLPLISPSIFTFALVKAIISQTSAMELSFALVAVALTLASPIASILAPSPISTVASTVLVMSSTPQSSVLAFLLVELAASLILPSPVKFLFTPSPVVSFVGLEGSTIVMAFVVVSTVAVNRSPSLTWKLPVLTTFSNTMPVRNKGNELALVVCPSPAVDCPALSFFKAI